MAVKAETEARAEIRRDRMTISDQLLPSLPTAPLFRFLLASDATTGMKNKYKHNMTSGQAPYAMGTANMIVNMKKARYNAGRLVLLRSDDNISTSSLNSVPALHVHTDGNAMVKRFCRDHFQ